MQNEQNKNNSFADTKIGFIDPVKIVNMVGIKEGDKVADFGCGPGYFSIPIAKTIGEDGEVYAFDVLPSAIEALESQALMQGIDNIIIKRANLERLKGSELKDESVEWVILKNILFQNNEKENIIGEAYRVLKKGGRVLVMEWDKNLSVGPSEKIRISPQDLIKMLDNKGFVTEKQFSAGNYHYVIIATKLYKI